MKVDEAKMAKREVGVVFGIECGDLPGRNERRLIIKSCRKRLFARDCFHISMPLILAKLYCLSF